MSSELPDVTRGAELEPRVGPAQWVLVLGAVSPIAHAIAAELARRGHGLILAGRDADELGRRASDLSLRFGTEVSAMGFDAADLASHAEFVSEVQERAGKQLSGVVVAVGQLGDHVRAVSDPGYAVGLLQTNFVGIVSVLTELADVLAARRSGFIIGITSVAGDRGRQSNFVYGAAKGGLALWLQGQRNRLSRSGVRVLTVKPGFVDTAMTFGMPGLFLVADPARVGVAIVRALDGWRDVIYIPWFWRYIMWVVKAIPESVFKRMRM